VRELRSRGRTWHEPAGAGNTTPPHPPLRDVLAKAMARSLGSVATTQMIRPCYETPSGQGTVIVLPTAKKGSRCNIQPCIEGP